MVSEEGEDEEEVEEGVDFELVDTDGTEFDKAGAAFDEEPAFEL